MQHRIAGIDPYKNGNALGTDCITATVNTKLKHLGFSMVVLLLMAAAIEGVSTVGWRVLTAKAARAAEGVDISRSAHAEPNMGHRLPISRCTDYRYGLHDNDSYKRNTPKWQLCTGLISYMKFATTWQPDLVTVAYGANDEQPLAERSAQFKDRLSNATGRKPFHSASQAKRFGQRRKRLGAGSPKRGESTRGAIAAISPSMAVIPVRSVTGSLPINCLKLRFQRSSGVSSKLA